MKLRNCSSLRGNELHIPTLRNTYFRNFIKILDKFKD